MGRTSGSSQRSSRDAVLGTMKFLRKKKSKKKTQTNDLPPHKKKSI